MESVGKCSGGDGNPEKQGQGCIDCYNDPAFSGYFTVFTKFGVEVGIPVGYFFQYKVAGECKRNGDIGVGYLGGYGRTDDDVGSF